MLKSNEGRIYFEREDQPSNSYFVSEVKYRYFAQEDDVVELEINPNFQEN